MKVLFLDIDGVMNTASVISKDGSYAIGEIFLERLKRIVQETETKIVLSSSWRLNEKSKEVVVTRLKEKELYLRDSTKFLQRKLSLIVPRSEEIQEWLNRHPKVQKFAILDDNDDAGENFEENFFQTTFEDGLTEQIMLDVISHLNG